MLKNVKEKRKEEDAVEGDLWDTYCAMMAVSFEKRIKFEKKKKGIDKIEQMFYSDCIRTFVLHEGDRLWKEMKN